jgi:hypothetical protein
MAFLIALSTLVVVAVVVLVVGAPIRRAHRPAQDRPGASLATDSPDAAATSAGKVQDLEAAREAKYREIRDAEMDFRTGKLSREDYDAIDADLRGEALQILNRLEPAEEESEETDGGSGGASGPGLLEQQERVQEEQHAEEDRPAV